MKIVIIEDLTADDRSVFFPYLRTELLAFIFLPFLFTEQYGIKKTGLISEDILEAFLT